MRIKIYAGFIRRHLLNRKLTSMGFTVRKDSGGKYFYRLVDNKDKAELKRLEKFCRRRSLNYSFTDETMSRSAGYRSSFFRENKGIFGSGIYMCAYCGRLMGSGKTRVDHIIPVKKAGTSKFYQGLLKLRGIKNVNDVRNLAPSCERCNSRKSAYGGLWVIRGLFGRIWIRVFLKELVYLVSGGFLLYFWYGFLHNMVQGYL